MFKNQIGNKNKKNSRLNQQNITPVNQKRNKNKKKRPDQQNIAPANQNTVLDSPNVGQSSDQSPNQFDDNIEDTFLYNISDDKLKSYYRYQHYIFTLQEMKTEWDTLIIYPECRAIINIEVKLGPRDGGNKIQLLKDASIQTKKHLDFMQKVFGNVLSKDWVFVKAACVPYLKIEKKNNQPCANCRQYILSESDISDITPWCHKLIKEKLATSRVDYQEEYGNLVAELIYSISIKESSILNKAMLDPLDLSRETEIALTGEIRGISGEINAPKYMLSKEQLNAKHSNESFLILGGDYGTGKTYVLKERLKTCAEMKQNSNILYIDLTGLTKLQIFTKNISIMEEIAKSEFESYDNVKMVQPIEINVFKQNSNIFYIDQPGVTKLQIFTKNISIMEEIAKSEFESYDNVKVVTVSDLLPDATNEQNLEEHISNKIYSYLVSNPCDHLFIDEMILTGDLIFPDTIETKCLTLKVDDEDDNNAKKIEELKLKHKLQYIHLNVNMRNSSQVISLSQSFDGRSINQNLFNYNSDHNIIGNHNFYFRYSHNIDPGKLAVAAVNKYFAYNPQESVVVMNSSKKDMENIFMTLKKCFSTTHTVIYSEESSDFVTYLQKPEGIFVTSILNFQGAQARNIILLIDETYTRIIRNCILRTMAFVIVIVRDTVKTNSVVTAIEDKNLHEFISTETT